MKDGWKQGVGPYSGNYAKFDRPVDRESITSNYDWLMEAAQRDRPGPVSKGGPPRHKPKTSPDTNGGMRQYPLTGKGKNPSTIKDGGYGQKHNPKPSPRKSSNPFR